MECYADDLAATDAALAALVPWLITLPPSIKPPRVGGTGGGDILLEWEHGRRTVLVFIDTEGAMTLATDDLSLDVVGVSIKGPVAADVVKWVAWAEEA